MHNARSGSGDGATMRPKLMMIRDLAILAEAEEEADDQLSVSGQQRGKQTCSRL